MGHDSPEDVKAEFIASYPGDLGRLAHRLWNDICILHTGLRAYLDLYSSKESVQLLNDAAPRFFAWLQGWLRHELLSLVSRLTDPPVTAGRENATLFALERDLRDCGEEATADVLRNSMQNIEANIERIRQIRHRTLAHTDRDTALQDADIPGITRNELQEVVEGLGSAFNAVDAQFRKAQTQFDGAGMFAGTDFLRVTLEHGVAALKANLNRSADGGD